jgi:glycosyltransferase involved in cell wall biosynthesis
MSPSPWWSASAPLLLKRLARAVLSADRIRRTFFIRHLDNHPEALLASAVFDAEARGLYNVCVFFSHAAEPDLLRLALMHARVSGVGTKDRFPDSTLSGALRDDPRVGRYWEPGRWCIPARAAHVYFVGSWRLLTCAMLLEAMRSGTASLRCRVAASWIPVPLTLIRGARYVFRASGLAALSRGARAIAAYGLAALSRGARAIAAYGLAALSRGARAIGACTIRTIRGAAVVRATLFIRHLDNMPEVLVASALHDAKRRGLGRITLFFSHLAEPEMVREVLRKDGIASTGVKDTAVDSILPADLAADRRVGRYWEPGGWVLPDPAEHVYFVGPWRLISTDMLREALRRNVSTLRVRVATSWATVPLSQIRSSLPLLRAAVRAASPLRQATRQSIGLARRSLADAILAVRPKSAEFATRVAGPSGIEGTSLDRLFRHMLRSAPLSAHAIPGRVVLVCGNLSPGGAERQVVYTLQGLAAAQRFESLQLLCHYLTRDSRHCYDFYLPELEAAGITAREIRRRPQSSNQASMPDGLKEIAKLLPGGLAVDIADLYWEFSELRPQLVHTWLDWDNVRGGLAAALAGVPRVVISGRNVNPSHFALYQPYMDPAYRALAQLPNVTIINNSRAGADDYADWIGIPRDRIRVVHNGVDFGNRSRLSATECADRRASLGIPEGSFVIGGMFRLEEEKRPMLWVQTAALLARQLPDMHFVIFGQGRMRDVVLQAAECEGISHRLTLAGVTNDVVSAMSIMDLFLLVSFGEGLPNVVLEAQWAGTPVVVTDVGGAKEALDPEVTGWAIDTDAPQHLAASIKRLHDNPAALQAARIKGPQWVRQQFGIARMVEETIRVYDLPHVALTGGVSCALSNSDEQAAI